jgi:hypothetical protein
MSMRLRLRLLSFVLFTGTWLVPIDLPFCPAPASWGQVLPDPEVGGQDFPGLPGQDMPQGEEGNTYRRRRTRAKAAAPKKAGRTSKDATSSADKTAKPKASAKSTEASGTPDSAGLKFSRDIAPILVDNCLGCHKPGSEGVDKGKLDMTTFSKLMLGTPKEKVISPGKPDDSELVARIKGEGGKPRMPRGRNAKGLSEDAISQIEEWIKAGAKLDAGIDAKAAMETYASSPEQFRRTQVAKLSPKERDRRIEAAGRQRWNKLKPEIISGEHFMIFSKMPKDRATATLKGMETQYGHLKRLLGSRATDWVEKVSLYVFSDRKDMVEFARTVETPERESSVVVSGNLKVPQPYVATADPLGGKKEEPSTARRKTRTKKGEEKDASGADRTLIGILTEQLADAAVTAQGKSPRWLAEGLAAYLSSQVDHRSSYFQMLRQMAWEKYRGGWLTKANEALAEGDQVSAEELRAIGFAIVECLMSEEFVKSFPAFVAGMNQGKEKLDDVLKEVYGASREDFLNKTGEWVAEKYGQDR